MDIFTKCYQHSFVDELRERDLFPYFRELQSRQDTEVIMEGKRRIMLEQLPRPDDEPGDHRRRAQGARRIRHRLQRQPPAQRHAESAPCL